MKRYNLLKIFLPILFVIALILGFIQHKADPYLGQNRYEIKNSPSQSQGDEFQYYINKANELAGKNNSETTASFLAVGDIMLSRNVAGTIKKANDPLLPFSRMADELKAVDFSVGNLESPMSGSEYFNPSGTMVFNMPTANIKGLVDYNFKLVTLANNHALDQGLKGLEFTKKFLAGNNIKAVGAGKNLNEAWQPAVVEQNGIKICFLGVSYASVNDNGKTTNDYVARIEDIENLKSKIENLKSLCDFTAVLMHAGTEYTTKPNQVQENFAHAAIDDGADMVIGSHPHWVQSVEKYNGKYIFYSLGNFIFDQEWSKETKEGLVLKITLKSSKQKNPTIGGAASLDDLQGTRIKATLENIDLIPVIIENYSTPRPANQEETKSILDKIGITQNPLK